MLIQKMERQPTDCVSAPPNERADRQRKACYGSPNADCMRPGFWLRKSICDDGQRHRIEHGRAQPLKSAEKYQRTDGVRHAAEQRSQQEENKAGLKNSPPPEAI